MKLISRYAAFSLALLLAAGVLALMAPAGGHAQTLIDTNARGAELTRDELTSLVTRLEEAATAPGYSRDLRAQAAREAGYVRERLEEGDFRVGDRVALQVEGEPQLSDTLTVTGQRTLEFPEIGQISLQGVLRSELEGHLTEELGRYLRDPRVRASSLVRIAVLGSVGSPGFYTLPASVLLEDALMSAGGPAGGADVENIEIRRGQGILWEGDLLQRAMVEGRTLDQLSLQAGDRIMVPARQPGFFEGGIIRTLLVTVPPLVYLIMRFL